MKVLLIQAPLGRKGGVLSAFPLGLAYLGGALKNVELTVIDPNTEAQPFEAVEKTIAKTKPDIIGLSLRNIDSSISSSIQSYFGLFADLVALVHKNRSSAKIVVGGTGFSIFPEQIMERFPEIDYGLFLEAEYSLPALLQNLKNPQKVPGLYYRKDGKVNFTGKGCLVDFGELDSPPRELEGLNLEWYKKIPHSFGVQTKRGCAFRCAYCTYPYLQGNSCRMRSPKKVVDEIENLVDAYGVEHIFFADTIFNYPFEHAREICLEIKRRKLSVKWSAWFKENYVNKQFLLDALDAGCVCFEFSPDGTSQKALDALQKDITIQDIKHTCELISEIKEAKVNYNFLRNVPGENLKSVSSCHKLIPWMVMSFWREISFIGFNSIRIYPHTEIYKIASNQGYLKAGQDLITPTFYDPFPLNAAYLPARCTNYLY
ncbi:MAG: cobalamin-dependent protein, partial [Candidatus Bathyarchaeota archaeon]|nr:cobalamin-dependent protein [Candidatus Bathyarchaeota archaeon]